MKSIFLVVAGLFMFAGAHAQSDSTGGIPPYLLHRDLPNFNLVKKDGSRWSLGQVPKNEPVVVIFFNPDCEHCQHEATILSQNMKKLKKVYFIWATYNSDFPEIEQFAKKYNLDGYANTHFLKDVAYAIPVFYKIQMTPFMAAYDKQKRLIKTWPAGASVEELIKIYN